MLQTIFQLLLLAPIARLTYKECRKPAVGAEPLLSPAVGVSFLVFTEWVPVVHSYFMTSIPLYVVALAIALSPPQAVHDVVRSTATWLDVGVKDTARRVGVGADAPGASVVARAAAMVTTMTDALQATFARGLGGGESATSKSGDTIAEGLLSAARDLTAVFADDPELSGDSTHGSSNTSDGRQWGPLREETTSQSAEGTTESEASRGFSQTSPTVRKRTRSTTAST